MALMRWWRLRSCARLKARCSPASSPLPRHVLQALSAQQQTALQTHTCVQESWLLAQGGALVVGDLEFKVAGDEGSLWTRGALPKGTTRK